MFPEASDQQVKWKRGSIQVRQEEGLIIVLFPKDTLFGNSL